MQQRPLMPEDPDSQRKEFAAAENAASFKQPGDERNHRATLQSACTTLGRTCTAYLRHMYHVTSKDHTLHSFTSQKQNLSECVT